MAQGVRLLALCLSCAAAAQPPPAQDDAPDQRIDFYALEAQRRAQGLRLTHYDYPPYGETQCKTLIDVQPWSPGGQIPFSCMMDRLKRLYLLAQDTWALGSELRAKQVALADDPSALIAGLLQVGEGPEATAERAAAALEEERAAAAERILAETAAFLQMESQAAARPLAPINIPQIQKLMKGLLWMLKECATMIDMVSRTNGVTGAL